MKIIQKDLGKGEIKIQIDSLDDLWFLSHIIEEEDQLAGKTLRKIKLGEDPDKNSKIIKKPVSLKIGVEKVEFHKHGNSLRVSGKVLEGPEDVPRASYHTFDLEEGSIIKIIKPLWQKYQLDQVKEACEAKGAKVLILALERDMVTYALLSPSGYTILAELEGEVGKKGYTDIQGKDFFMEVEKHLEEYVQRYNIEHIILASPAFWKEDLLNIIKKKNPLLAPKITLATCNATGKNAIEEILKRDEIKTVLKNDRTVRESALVEMLLKEIAKNAHAAYGWKEVKVAGEAHAIKILLISDAYLQEQRVAGNYQEIDILMKEVDRAKGEVHIISTEHDGGKKLHALGGVAAILRFSLK